MRKKFSMLLVSALAAVLMAGCGGDAKTETEVITSFEAAPDQGEVGEVTKEEVTTEEVVVEDVIPEGMYRSELTNELISEEIKNQRPIAAMVDNDKRALPHYGISQADVVYEMMNSTANGRITRLMVLVKDWDKIKQLGSIRSLRPTNILLAAEWDAVVCHDGGPYHNDAYMKYVNNFSGGFSRVNNGKAREFTEYIMTGDLQSRFKNSKISTEYRDTYEGGQHFNFASEANPVDLSTEALSKSASKVKLPFKNNGSYLVYDTETQTYDYFEHGSAHVDAGNGNKQTTFKNVILQDMTFNQLDENGYMIFNCIGGGNGWYMTNGTAIPIVWKKDSAYAMTHFYDMAGNEITINTGKTYIALVPSDNFASVVIE